MYTNPSQNIPSKALSDAVQALRDLPGVGERSAMRLALHLLAQPQEKLLSFGDAIRSLATDIRYCSRCGVPCDGELCPTCADPRREQNTVCVTETLRDQMSIEATGSFRGVYHLLGGHISPIDGIGPSDLRIRELTERIEEMQRTGTEKQPEIILALSGDVEGETTALYLFRKLEPYDVKVSTLARGVSFGTDLEYADSVTLGRALIQRIPFLPK